jgi:hypothetical protein
MWSINMSTMAWGSIIFEDKLVSEKENISLAFKIIIIAAKYNIAIDLGARVKPWVYERFKKLEFSPNSLPFQLTNHSLDPNVNALFTGEGNEVLEESWDESLESRMERIQEFIEETLCIKLIKRIIFYIDPGYNNENVLIINANEFKSKIIELFLLNNNMTPNIKFIIYNS